MTSIGREVDYAAKLFSASIEYVDRFRVLMRKYGALVAGSSVLRLFVDDHAVRHGQQPQAWAPSDLDVYVPRVSLGSMGLVEWPVFFTMIEKMKLEQPDAVSEEQYREGEVR